MRLAIKIALAASGLLVLSACGSEGAPTASASQAGTVPATGSATPSVASSAPAQVSPVGEKRIITNRRVIPFKTMKVNDSTLSKGTTRVRNPGARGVEILTYKVTFLN